MCQVLYFSNHPLSPFKSNANIRTKVCSGCPKPSNGQISPKKHFDSFSLFDQEIGIKLLWLPLNLNWLLFSSYTAYTEAYRPTFIAISLLDCYDN